MKCDWRTMTLAEAGVRLIDCDHKTPKAQNTGFHYVGIPQLKDCRITLDGARLISEADFHHWRRKAKPQEHDVILSRRCNPGETGYVTADLNIALGQNLVLLRSDGKTVHPPFLRWLTRGNAWWNQVNAFINVGAVFESLKCADIPKFEVTIPSFENQKLICACLSAIDDKIAMNTQINQSLEEMAQAIFKSWFVDFDPVKAKMEGEQPEGVDEATAELFPDRFVESELGLIPERWETIPFSSWVKITKGKNITKKTIIEGDVPVVAGGLKPAYYHNMHNVDGPVITISASGANAGFINLYFENIWASDCSYISKSTAPLFFLHYVALKYNQKKIFGMQTGAAQPHIYPRDFERLIISIPNDKISQKLEEIFASFFRVISNNKKQNSELIKLRDTLLPKLLSGEIKLNQAKDLAEVD